MKYYVFLVVGILLMAFSIALAGDMTFTSELPSATTSTLGENQKREMLKKNVNEMRVRLKALGRFAGYTTQGNNDAY